MEKVTKDFYKKDIEYNKFFFEKKKISFDTNDYFLEIIDKLAKLSKNSRTVVINALIGAGMSPCVQMWEKTWKEYLKNKELDERIKKAVNQTLLNLKKFKKEYHIADLEKLEKEHYMEKG